MDAVTVNSHIRELESLRSRTRFWRTGATLLALLIAVARVGTMYSNVRSLFSPGPRQDEFVSHVNAGLQQNVVPGLQRLAVQTAVESGPIIQSSFVKLNDRLPEISQASMQEFETLQTNLPQRSEKVLDETFGAMIKSREDKLRKMFPDATDEKIQTLITNLTDEGVTCLSNVNKQLFSKHVATMKGIATDIQTIEQLEAAHIKNDTPTWQMGLLLFDIARPDLEKLAVSPDADGAETSGSSGLQETSLSLNASMPNAVSPKAASPKAVSPKPSQSSGY